MFRGYFYNASWMILEKISTIGIGYLVLIVIAKNVSISVFGEFNLAFSIVALLSSLTKFGLDNFIIAEVSKERFCVKNIVFESFKIILFLSIFVVALVFSVVVVFDLSDLIFYFSVCLIFQSFIVFELALQARLKSKMVLKIKSIVLFATGVAKVLMVSNGVELKYVALIFSLDFIFVGIFCLMVFHKIANEKHSDVPNISKRVIVSRSFPLMLSGLVSILSIRLDQFAISYFYGLEELGFYAAAGKFAEALVSIFGVVSAAMLPLLGKALNTERYNKIKKAMLLSFVTAGVFSALTIALFSDVIISVLFGEGFDESVNYLNIMSIYILIMSLVTYSNRVYVVEGLNDLVLYRTLGYLSITVMSYFPFMSFFGSYGILYANVLGLLVSYILINIKYERVKTV